MNHLHSIPMPGDCVRLDGYYCGAKRGGFAVLQGTLGEARDTYYACFGASAFRDNRYVSCSGGPVPDIAIEELYATGETRMQTFWRWKDGIAGAHRGDYYELEVPVWSWSPKSSRYRIEAALGTYRFWEAEEGLYTRGAQQASRILGYPVVEREMEPIQIAKGIPEAIGRFVFWLCTKAKIGGSCDPMYISNVIAAENGRGDGRGEFFAPANCRPFNPEDAKRTVDRLLNSYFSCIHGKVKYEEMHGNLVTALLADIPSGHINP